jgi:OFA family oxalate/formate antiporter-like MFS transporter
LILFPLLSKSASIPWLFMAMIFVVLSCYGGGFSTMPAYIADLFGISEMPVVFGRILTAWSAAGVVGPMLNAWVYERTHSYEGSLWVFSALLLLGLGVAVAMRALVPRHRCL